MNSSRPGRLRSRVREVPLTGAAMSIGYVILKGRREGSGRDLGLELAVDGYEVWQRPGASVGSPHVLPVKANF